MASCQPVLVNRDLQWPNAMARNGTTWLKRVLQFYLHEMPIRGKIHTDSMQTDGCQGLEDGEMGSDRLMDTEFYFGMRKRFGTRLRWQLDKVVNALHATESFTVSKTVHFMSCDFYSIK